MADVKLTPREQEALQWAAEGNTECETGERMGSCKHGVDMSSAHGRALHLPEGGQAPWSTARVVNVYCMIRDNFNVPRAGWETALGQTAAQAALLFLGGRSCCGRDDYLELMSP